MINSGLAVFRNKRVLLLQGPVGPFFRRFGKDLKAAGAHVSKVNFNGGDWLFYPEDAISYRGDIEGWPEFFCDLITTLAIDTIIFFGDCRAYHTKAYELAQQIGLDVAVFEEGYLRPNHVTLEREGVNGHSELPTNPIFYLNNNASHAKADIPVDQVGNTFWYAAAWACLYYLAAQLLRPMFPNYEHHRPLTVMESRFWVRSFLRRGWYAVKQLGIQHRLVTEHPGNFFLVPLQVHNDAQIRVHSDFKTMDAFLHHVVESFARCAPAGTLLVIKHHPMDRGYCNYAALLKQLARDHNLEERLLYIHDQHLPTLLQKARGVVLVNSTVGLSALHHRAPVKVCGESIYSIKGLVYQGTLDDFWIDSKHEVVNEILFKNFQNYIIERTQINGSFYKRLRIPGSATGMRWDGRRAWARHIDISTSDVVHPARRSTDRAPMVAPRPTYARASDSKQVVNQ